MIRWGYQKGLVVVTKTATPSRMLENRDIFSFLLDDDEMKLLDGLTSADDIVKREQLEAERKSQL